MPHKTFPLDALKAYKKQEPETPPNVTVNFDLAPLIALLTQTLTPNHEVKTRGQFSPVGA
jgi:hypothetical protein